MEASNKNKTFKAFKNKKESFYKSKHYLLELYGCDYEKSNELLNECDIVIRKIESNRK